jgi:hypothetical protein
MFLGINMFWPFSELILTVSGEKYINAQEHQDYCYIKELCLVRTSFILVYSSVYIQLHVLNLYIVFWWVCKLYEKDSLDRVICVIYNWQIDRAIRISKVNFVESKLNSFMDAQWAPMHATCMHSILNCKRSCWYQTMLNAWKHLCVGKKP